MAYMSQERKAEIVALAKPILKKYGIKASFAVRNHSTIVCNIKSGKIDFMEQADIMNVNPYHYDKYYHGWALAFLKELFAALNNGNWDKSDIQTDYFDVGHYVDVNIGNWNKPYVVEK